MPKRRLMKLTLASVSLVALGAGLQAGWSNLNSRPGGAWSATEKAWASLVEPREKSNPSAKTPVTAPITTASIEKPSVSAGLAFDPAPLAEKPAPVPPSNASAVETVPAGKINMRADDPPANALGAIGAVTAPAPRTATSAISEPVGVISPVAAYAPLPGASEKVETPAGGLPPAEPALTMPVDVTGVREAITAYKAGDVAKGDAAAQTATNEMARLTLEWAALRLQPRPAGFNRIEAFLQKNPDWPQADWLRARAEQTMYADRLPAARIAKWYETNKPASPAGHMLVARTLLAQGKKADAATIIARLWREDDLGTWAEGALQKEFGELLTSADHRWRSDRYFYKEKYPQSLAAAGLAGKEFLAFANARIAVAKGADPAKTAAKIDAKLRGDPTWQFAQITRLRKAQKYEEAAKLLLEAPDDPSKLVDANEWWEERRITARKRLDSGDAQSAYTISAKHGALNGETFISAEFHAGWIALRFLKKPEEALEHFARAGEVATTPMSRSRAAYWQARAAEQGPDPQDADRLYVLAAQYSSSYYGQLAMERLGWKDLNIRTADKVAEGDERLPAIRTIELLEALGEKELSLSLVAGIGRTLEDKSQLAALAAVLSKSKHARATLVAGKLAAQRGIELDDIAFPTYGIPDFTPLANSAAKPVVYAIARQESAFQAQVVSHAGAKGLMQMLTSTAARTAKNKNVPFDANKLLNDAAFNAQLGAAHLGELMEEHPGSLLMVFAAYNAGGHRVKQWIAAYGDPRKPGVDPIDWVERIPFTETRNYVQRVAENLAVYRKLLQENSVPRVAEKELRAYAARM